MSATDEYHCNTNSPCRRSMAKRQTCWTEQYGRGFIENRFWKNDRPCCNDCQARLPQRSRPDDIRTSTASSWRSPHSEYPTSLRGCFADSWKEDRWSYRNDCIFRLSPSQSQKFVQTGYQITFIWYPVSSPNALFLVHSTTAASPVASVMKTCCARCIYGTHSDYDVRSSLMILRCFLSKEIVAFWFSMRYTNWYTAQWLVTNTDSITNYYSET